MGIWYALSRRRLREGTAIAAVGSLPTLVSVGVVLPHFNEAPPRASTGAMRALGGSPSEVVETVFTHPGRVISTAFDGEGIRYLIDLLLPLALLFVAAPLALVAAVPELALNLLSATGRRTRSITTTRRG